MADSDSTPRILTFCKTAVISRDFCRFRLDVEVVVMKHVCTQWYSAIEWTKQFKTCTHRLLKNSITFNNFPIFLFCPYFWQLIVINCLLEIHVFISCIYWIWFLKGIQLGMIKADLKIETLMIISISSILCIIIHRHS